MNKPNETQVVPTVLRTRPTLHLNRNTTSGGHRARAVEPRTVVRVFPRKDFELSRSLPFVSSDATDHPAHRTAPT